MLCLIAVTIFTIIGAYEFNILKLKGETYETYDFGDEFCIDTECFYTITDNVDTLTAIAKYNLLVGYNVLWMRIKTL